MKTDRLSKCFFIVAIIVLLTLTGCGNNVIKEGDIIVASKDAYVSYGDGSSCYIWKGQSAVVEKTLTGNIGNSKLLVSSDSEFCSGYTWSKFFSPAN